MNSEKPLGSVIQGSLSNGLEVKLHPDVSVAEMRVGKFLVIGGARSLFFCILTDVTLGTSSDRILINPIKANRGDRPSLILSLNKNNPGRAMTKIREIWRHFVKKI